MKIGDVLVFDLLEWLTPLIRDANLTTESFIQAAKLNRSLFYNGVKEPKKFSSTHMENIAIALNLSDAQKHQLFSFQEKPTPEQTELKRIAENILFSEPAIFDMDTTEYSFYESSSEIIGTYTSKLLAKQIVEKSFEQNLVVGSVGFHHSFHVTIYNCISEIMILALASLFYHLEKYLEKPSTVSLQVNHIIHQQKENLIDRLNLYKTLLPLRSTLSDYSCFEGDIENPIWSKNDDMCLIQYRVMKANNEDALNTKYFLLNLYNEEAAISTSFDDVHLYKYFLVDAKGKRFKNIPVNSALNTNIQAYEAAVSHKEFLFHYDFCFHDIAKEYWLKVLERVKEYSPEDKKQIANIMDPQNFYSGLDDMQKIVLGIDYIGKRHDITSLNGSVSILTAFGLSEFTNKRYISDLAIPVKSEDGKVETMLGEKMRFEPEEIVEHLRKVQKQLGDKAESNKRKYYLVKHRTQIRGHSYLLFKGKFLWVTSPHSLHIIDGGINFNETGVINAICYKMEDLIAKRNDPDSILMTDNEAFDFVEMLIERLRYKSTS